MKTSSDYEYGTTSTRESSVPRDKSDSSSSTLKEGRDESTTLPLQYQQPESAWTQNQTPDASMWSTPSKNISSRTETYQGESTPATITSPDYGSSDFSVSPSRRGRIYQGEADEVRLSINFEQARYRDRPNMLGKRKTKVLVQTFVPKFVLEVMGGAGAVWGFSEAIGLRTSATVWFWRPTSLFVGFLFFIRWCRQLYEFSELDDDGARQRLADGADNETTALMFQENG